MNMIMVDLETMGNKPNAAIVAIGAVRFNHDRILNTFYRVVDLQSSVDAGLDIDAGTVLWWLKQSEQARAELTGDSVTLTVALDAFTSFVKCGDGAAQIWGNGATFDNVILANAYDALGLNRPWKYWNDCCYRTIANMNKDIKMARTGTHHNAVDDAESQAVHLIKILSAQR